MLQSCPGNEVGSSSADSEHTMSQVPNLWIKGPPILEKPACNVNAKNSVRLAISALVWEIRGTLYADSTDYLNWFSKVATPLYLQRYTANRSILFSL